MPPAPPPRIPAMEFPTVPRLFSFMAAPATLPPTAPLIASIMRLMMFIGLVSCFVRACLIETVRERDPVKIGTPSSCIALPLLVLVHIPPDESDVARPQCPATCDGGHAALRLISRDQKRQ